MFNKINEEYCRNCNSLFMMFVLSKLKHTYNCTSNFLPQFANFIVIVLHYKYKFSKEIEKWKIAPKMEEDEYDDNNLYNIYNDI